MGIMIENETTLYNLYNTLTKKKYSFLLCKIKNIDLIRYLYGKECDNSLYKDIQAICLNVLDEHSYLYRMYSDNFIILLDSQDPYFIIQHIYALDESISKYTFKDIQHTISLSIGIFKMKRQTDFYKAYDYAKFALLNSKDLLKYNTSFEFYKPKEIELAKQQFKMLHDLENALDHHEFEIYLQPKVETTSYKVVGAEALIRWIHLGKLVPLNIFMPLIDRNAFIRRIDLFVFQEVCALLDRWSHENKTLYPISVNISKASFEDGFYYLKEIESIFNQYSLDKQLIEFELSEEICFEDNHRLHRFLNLLNDNGFTCSLDDFGSGHSSFLALTYLPIHIIKLDSSFCLGVWDHKKQLILIHLLHLLNALHFTIIAEGIETKEIADFFSAHSAHMLQGFYFSEALPISRFEEYVQQHTTS